jgi:glyoxylase I family protein
MATAFLEHVNITVSDPVKTAENLEKLFGWHIRWQGKAKDNGWTVHVGNDSSYVAVYSVGTPQTSGEISYETRGGLNHVGVVVDDLKAAEERVREMGYAPHSHADYEPGERFYFDGDDGIEFEVISYS